VTARKIVILTPVRDEDWILGRFLMAACEVADHVLVLDQKSEDRSREICGRFPKVTVLENPSSEYNERSRAQILVESARKLFGGGNVLVALDADEILTGDSLQPAAWDELRALAAGTVICFEKPEMLPQPPRCVRSSYWFPMGFVDDGNDYAGRLIHSNRLPLKQEWPRFYTARIVAMHFARLRPMEFAARQAFYCMVENANRTKSHRVRNCYYSPSRFLRYGEEEAQTCPAAWFAWFEARGVSLWSYHTERFNAFHRRALALMAQKGASHFWWDDVWWEDWEAARRFFNERGVAGMPAEPVRSPPVWMPLLLSQVLRTYALMNRLAMIGRTFFGRLERPAMHV
jgi:hypothetical protein